MFSCAGCAQLIPCLSEMAVVLKILVYLRNYVYIFSSVKNDQKCPNKMIDCSCDTFYTRPLNGQFNLINVFGRCPAHCAVQH